jgi:hypothetical protein
MEDQITRLCDELVWVEDPRDLYPVSEQLQKAIHQRVERVRDHAFGVVMIDHVVDLDEVLAGQSGDTVPSHEQSG